MLIHGCDRAGSPAGRYIYGHISPTGARLSVAMVVPISCTGVTALFGQARAVCLYQLCMKCTVLLQFKFSWWNTE
uniref:Uncharacterized protein n=1 Tax=Anguilla anguilla TaxID=7936 RepID=A0A0E9RMA5_ANGAN